MKASHSEKLGPMSFPAELWDDPNYKKWGKGFWGDARLRIIYESLKDRGLESLLDIGSGDGEMVSIPLAGKGVSVWCVEPIAAGAASTRDAGLDTYNMTLAEASSTLQPVPAVGAFDVMEYFSDSSEFLGLIRQLLIPGGFLFLTIPAHSWLYSDYDLAVGNLRRFSRSTVIEDLKSAGFSVEKLHGLFGFLIPLVFLTRRLPYLLGLRRSHEHFDWQAKGMSRIPPVMESFLVGLAMAEVRVSARWGLSWFVIARFGGQEE